MFSFCDPYATTNRFSFDDWHEMGVFCPILTAHPSESADVPVFTFRFSSVPGFSAGWFLIRLKIIDTFVQFAFLSRNPRGYSLSSFRCVTKLSHFCPTVTHWFPCSMRFIKNMADTPFLPDFTLNDEKAAVCMWVIVERYTYKTSKLRVTTRRITLLIR